MRWWPWRRRVHPGNGEAARAAKRAAEGKLRDARRDWPEVIRAEEVLVQMIEQTLRGRPT